jgi:hypothetical protein
VTWKHIATSKSCDFHVDNAEITIVPCTTIQLLCVSPLWNRSYRSNRIILVATRQYAGVASPSAWTSSECLISQHVWLLHSVTANNKPRVPNNTAERIFFQLLKVLQICTEIIMVWQSERCKVSSRLPTMLSNNERINQDWSVLAFFQSNRLSRVFLTTHNWCVCIKVLYG